MKSICGSLALALLLGLSACARLQQAAPALVSAQDLAFLEEMTRAVMEESRVLPDGFVGDIGPNTTGQTLIRPGGRAAYPAFWIRDYAMSLEAGLVTPAEQRHALWLTASQQVDETRLLPSGSILPPGSIPDHITFLGVPIFFPGTLDDAELQGGPQWGRFPSLDDHFYFVHMARVYAETQGQNAFLLDEVNGKPLLQRLEEAYALPPAREDNFLVSVVDENRGVNFGFFDTVVHTGDLFFCSLLKYQAATELASLLESVGEKDRARRYRAEARTISRALAPTFQERGGFFRASTGKSSQPDVWGTAFAVYLRALPEASERLACKALREALGAGTIQWEGGIRHVPTDRDFSAETSWEIGYTAVNRYQNGAYWDTPLGWVCFAVAQVDSGAAAALAQDYLEQLREDDFRLGPDHGAPWECRHQAENHRQNPVYLASVACPLAALRRMNAEAPLRLLPGARVSLQINETF